MKRQPDAMLVVDLPQGGDRGKGGGATSRPAGRGARRHELRPRRGRLRRPGQRRRHQVVRSRLIRTIADAIEAGKQKVKPRGVPGANAFRARGRGRGCYRRGSARRAARRRGGSGRRGAGSCRGRLQQSRSLSSCRGGSSSRGASSRGGGLRPPRKLLPRRRCQPNDLGHGGHGQGAARDDGRAR